MIKQIKFICQTYGIWPQKSKGQNFLTNKEVLKKIIYAADLATDDIVLEVGPGLGILTEVLVRRVKKVISIELDKKLFSFLQTKFQGVRNLELINEDILKIQNSKFKIQNYRVVANLPYNITSNFLRKFLTAEIKPTDMVLLVQKEVAQRVCSLPGEMSLLAVSVQLYGQPKIIDVVRKDNFWPKPKVDSAILKISEIKSKKETEIWLDGISEKQFWQLVKIGFSAKRKQLANNLAAGLKIPVALVKTALSQTKLESKVRAQNLSLADWLALAKNLKVYLN